MADINHTLNETFQGFQVIRSFTLEKTIFRNFSRKTKDYYHFELKNAKLQGWYSSAGYLLNSIVFLFSLCLGAYFVSEKTMTVGTFINVHESCWLFSISINRLGQSMGRFSTFIAAMERVIDLLKNQLHQTNYHLSLPL